MSRAARIRTRVLEYVDTDAEHRAAWLNDAAYVMSVEASIGMLCNVDANLEQLDWTIGERDHLIDLVLARWRDDVDRDRSARALAEQTSLVGVTMNEFDKPG